MTYTISNKKLARIAGLLYLMVIIAGLFAEIFVRQALQVPGDALATARNIQASENLYRAGFVADLFNLICGFPDVLIMYILFKPVSRHLVSLAIFFVLVQTAVIAVNLLNQLSPLLFLEDKHYLAAFTAAQRSAMATNALNLQSQGYAIALVFFGFYCIIFGYLIFKSTLIPKLLGILYAIAGLSYLVNSFSLFLFPKLSGIVFPVTAVPAFIGELSLCLWLLVKGVRDKGTTTI